MAMNFWEAQRSARRLTTLYLTVFFVLIMAVAVLGEFALRTLDPQDYDLPFPAFGLAFLTLTVMVAAYNYMMYKQQGGGYVAESLGAYQIFPDTKDSKERQLLNIVQETAIAASVPMPSVYVLESGQINAFAAGLTKDNSAICVTEGTMHRLNRDELQGVIAHEFGHIYNGDMVISLRLAAMVMGFFFVLYIGLRLMQGSSFRSRDSEGKQGNPILLIAIALMIAGALTWFLGSILKAMVSRQREYLADACAVQFTRNPNGIANALKKIANDKYDDMPKTGSAYSHMYFEDHSSIFATHPPIEKRIAAIEGRTYLTKEMNVKNDQEDQKE